MTNRSNVTQNTTHWKFIWREKISSGSRFSSPRASKCIPKSPTATMDMFSLLENSWTLCGLKSVRASKHPEEGVCQFTLQIFAMSQSSKSILDHIAEILRFISNALLFWFTLNTSYDHGCHLANPFHLDPNNYEVLLVVASLTHYTGFGFAMKPTAWRKFLEGVTGL